MSLLQLCPFSGATSQFNCIMSIIVSHTRIEWRAENRGEREIERCRKYFSTLNDNQFQLWLFIVVVIAAENGLPNRNIRHLNVFCFRMANVLKAKLSNITQ